MDRDRQLLRHFLAAIAYRTQKAVRGAPQHYPGFSAGNRTRTPAEIVRHMASLMGYVTTHFVGGTYPARPDPLPTFAAEVARFHEMLQKVGDLLSAGTPLRDITTEQLLQGPFADTMTHVGHCWRARVRTASAVRALRTGEPRSRPVPMTRLVKIRSSESRMAEDVIKSPPARARRCGCAGIPPTAG